MRRPAAVGVLVMAICGADAAAAAAPAQANPSTPTVPLVSIVGCARRSPQGTWTLTNATDGVDARVLFLSAKEIEDARKQALGTKRYTLVGTADFVTKEELLKSGRRAEFTRPDVANATGQLQDGRKLLVRGLLITAAGDTRLNLVAVQQLADTCM